MTTRKEIRDTVAQLLEPALAALDPNINVCTFKKNDPERGDTLVCVYLEEADIDNAVGYAENMADMTIHVLMPNRAEVDDQLDTIGDQCEATLADNFLLGDLLTNQLLGGWKYERELIPGWTGLTLTYQIRW